MSGLYTIRMYMWVTASIIFACSCKVCMRVKRRTASCTCAQLMNNFVSGKKCHFLLHHTVYVWVCVFLCRRMCTRPAFSASLPCAVTLTVFAEALIDKEPPALCVLSEHRSLVAGSTNLGAPNSAICPAMCSYVPAGSSQQHACLTRWLCASGTAQLQTETSTCVRMKQWANSVGWRSNYTSRTGG